MHQALLRQLGQQVQVAQDQRTLGDDGHWMPIAQQHLENPAGDPLFTLDRLIGIGVGPQRDWRTLVAAPGQLLFQHIGGIGLGDQLRFEIQPR